MRKYLIIILMVVLAGCSTLLGGNSGDNAAQFATKELIVSAAASLQDSLTEIQKNYALANPGIKLTFNFGASGTLQQQIEQGAPVDLFISAGQAQMDALAQKHLLLDGSRVDLLGNDLVLVVPKDNDGITSIQDLGKKGMGNIGLGTPESVPAGKYAQESLTKFGLWNSLQPRLVFAKDVTQVLNYVETGNVDAGFVYASDARTSTKVKIVSVIPANSHAPIDYPAAVIANTKSRQAATDLLKYLQSPVSQQVFIKYGFRTLAG